MSLIKEETEVKKDIEWLKEKIKEEHEYNRTKHNKEGFEGYAHRGFAFKHVLKLINQLDEPELLAQEWIDRNKEPFHHFETKKVDYYVSTDFLQNLLVPEQELPVIPQFVAYVIEAYKSNSILTDLLADLAFHGGLAEFVEHEDEDEVFEWARSNRKATDEILARAWLYGYEVAEEQKYIISINITDKDSKTNYETFLNKRGIFHSMENDSFNSEEFNWSEEEIRGLTKGDILFEHFAIKVEELEE